MEERIGNLTQFHQIALAETYVHTLKLISSTHASHAAHERVALTRSTRAVAMPSENQLRLGCHNKQQLVLIFFIFPGPSMSPGQKAK